MTASFVTHPLDTIKVRLQLNQNLTSAKTLKKMLREENIMVLYKGLSASLLREASYSTLRMGLYDPFKKMIDSGGPLPLWKRVFAAGMAGMIGAAIANPADLIKVRFQAFSKET